jgi:hypothetical protein
MVVAAGAALANGQVTPNNGDIIFTSQTPAGNNSVKLISGTVPTVGPATLLYSSGSASSYFAGIQQAPDGNYYLLDGRQPFPNTTDAGVLKIQNIFSGAPTVTQHRQGNPLQNPISLAWSNDTNEFITVSNPGTPQVPATIDGIFGFGTGPAGINTYYPEPNPIVGVRPRYYAGYGIIKDPRPGSQDFLVTTINGGVATNPTPLFGSIDAESSTLWRLQYTGSGYVLNPTPVVDFAASFTGAASSFYNTRGIAAVPGTNSVYVADIEAGVINKVTLDGLGNFQSITTILSGLNLPENLIYNQYTGQLVFEERSIDLLGAKISTVNLDGSGLTLLYAGEHARGFAIVPSPSALALLGLGGVVVARRRRR